MTEETKEGEVRDEDVVEVLPAHAEGERWCEVVVHVYDLSEEMNDRLYRVGLGLYHSGVELVELDREYWFQGHDQRYTGVLELDHRTALRAIPCVRESVSLGRTALSRAAIAAAVDRLTLAYRGCTYNVVRRHCNAFCADLVRALAPERRRRPPPRPPRLFRLVEHGPLRRPQIRRRARPPRRRRRTLCRP